MPWAGSWEAGEGPTLSLQVEGRRGPASGFPLAVFKLKLHEASVCRADQAAQVCRADWVAQVCRADRVAPCPLLTGRSSFSVEGGRAISDRWCGDRKGQSGGLGPLQCRGGGVVDPGPTCTTPLWSAMGDDAKARVPRCVTLPNSPVKGDGHCLQFADGQTEA